MNRNGLLIALTAITFAAPALAADYGAPMPAGETVDIAAAVAAVDAHDDAPGKFSGRIVEVCQKKGCWVMLESDGKVARVMAKDHGFAVPKDASGAAVVYGTLSRIELSQKDAKHFAEDAGRKGAVQTEEYRIEATSIAIADAQPAAADVSTHTEI